MVHGDAIRFTRISTADGLSQTRAAVIVQDDRGFIWFGTEYGLNRYDGYNFKLYVHDPRKKDSLGGVYISALFKDQAGNLWVGSAQTLDRFDPVTESFTHYSIKSTDSNGMAATVVDISQTSNGLIWLATGSGLFSLDPAKGKLTQYRHKPGDFSSLSSDDVKTSREDKSGEFWVGTSMGLDRFDQTTGKVVERVVLPEPKYISFYEDRTGAFWIYHASGNGLDLYDRAKKTLTHFLFGDGWKSGGSFTGVSAMLEDDAGSLWIGSRTCGMLRFDRERQRLVQYKNDPSDPDSLGEDSVICLLKDREGNIWTGLHSSGPNRFNPKPSNFQVYRREPSNPDSLDSNFLTAIHEDRQSNLWFASDAGLIRVDRNTRSYSRFADGLGQRPGVISIAEDEAGAIWVGTYGNGIARFDQTTGHFTSYTHHSADPSSLCSNQVERVFVDRSGTLWAATTDGLCRFDRARNGFETFKVDQQNHRAQCYTSIAEDQNGILWLGTTYSGLHRFDPRTGQFSVYRGGSGGVTSPSDNTILSVYVARSGTIWVGTLIGLDEFSPKAGRFLAHLSSDSSRGHTVSSILEDDVGRLWMSSNEGLFSFDPRTDVFKNYSFFAGLSGNDLSGFGASCRTSRGIMYFGGFAGGISFDPSKLADSSDAPPTVLTKLLLSNTPIEAGTDPIVNSSITYARELKLSHEQHSFSLEFAALSFVDPLGNHFRYRMEGFESEWKEVTARNRQASYTLLPPGRYVFQVESATSSGKWIEPGVVLPVTILPAWWQTWWSRSLAVTAGVAMLVTGYLMRIRDIQRREHSLRQQAESRHEAVMAERTRIARDLHDTFAQGFTGVVVQLEAAKEAIKKESASDTMAHIDSASEMARTCLGEARRSVRDMRLKWLDDCPLPRALDRLLKSMAFGTSLKPHLVLEGKQRTLPAFWEEGLLRIVQESLTNTIKHAGAKNYCATLRVSLDGVEMVLEDDGEGFDRRAETDGFGLSGMNERAERMGGRFIIETAPGRGTKIQVTIVSTALVRNA